MKAKKNSYINQTPSPAERISLYYNQGCFRFKLELEGDLVVRVGFLKPDGPEAAEPNSAHPYIDMLDCYLRGINQRLELPHALRVTDFARKVYTATSDIPPGETSTYGAIATRIGAPQAARAVGAALRANPLPLIVPCHRVVGASGKLTGFAGGLELKLRLQELEKRS